MRVFSIRQNLFENAMPQQGMTPIVYPFRAGKENKFRSKILGLISTFKEAKADIFYFQKDPQLTPELLAKLKAASPRTKFVMIYHDQRGGVPPDVSVRKNFLDAVLINNSDPNQLQMYRNAGIPHSFTFHHCIPVDEFKNFGVTPKYDVMFGGTNYHKTGFPLSRLRYDFILKVKAKFNLAVCGFGWPFKKEKFVPRHQYARVLRTAHINLGINHFDVLRYYNSRLFECMGSGKMHLTYYIPGMERDFVNHVHLIWFKSIPEGLDLIKHYLKNAEKREKIAAEGRRFVFKRHNHQVRLSELKKIFSSI